MLERIYVEAKLNELRREVEAGRVSRAAWQARAEARRAGLKGEGMFGRIFSRRQPTPATSDGAATHDQLPQVA